VPGEILIREQAFQSSESVLPMYHKYSGLFLSILLVVLHACVSTPKPPSHEQRAQLGRIGVLALSSTPRTEFETFAKGWAAGVAKGGAFGAAEGLLTSIAEVLRNPPSGPYAGPAILITAIVVTTVHTVVYGVAGGLEAVPGKTALKIEKELIASIGDVNLSADLAKEIYNISALRPDLLEHKIKIIGLPIADTTPAYDGFSKQGFDTIVEVQIKEAGFRGGSGSQPNVRFYLNVSIRLVSAGNGTELYTRDFQFLSHELLFVEWFFEGSKQLISVFKQAVENLADRILDELFLITSFPFDSGLWALPSQPEFGTCWFRPIYPELHYSSLWYSISHNSPGIHVLFTEVDSLQPTLKWEPFPRPRDRKKGNEALLNKISDVSYDLKIWEVKNDFPARLVYDKTGLLEAAHRLSVPLRSGTKYSWTFRARYKLAGRSQVTRWAFSNIPSNVPSDYPVRRSGGNCELDAIPITNYFRFMTPDT